MTKKTKIVWQQIWARRYAPFLGCSYLATFMREDPKFSICRDRRFVPEGGLYGYYFNQDELRRLIATFESYLLKQNIKKFANQYEKIFREMLRWSVRFGRQKFFEFSNQKLARLVKELDYQYRKYGEWQLLSFIALEGPVKKVELIVTDKKILASIITPHKETKINRARLELLKLCIKRQISTGVLEKYLKKYSWLPVYDFIDPLLKLSDLKKQLLPTAQAKKEFNAYFRNRFRGLKIYKKYFSAIKDQQTKKLVAIAHYFTYLKEMRDDYRRPAYLACRPFFEEIAKRLKLTFIETNYFLPDELAKALKKSKINYKKLAKRRKQSFALELRVGKVKIYSGEKKSNNLAESTVARHIDKEVRGSIVFPGKAVGKVKIIYHKEEFSKFNQGDILVTAMTHPEFISIMRQARAIVTDEGGLTSHAAITAREMKKPCIVGTKIATKVLKDGDMVEVDADKGVVRIIK